MKHDPEVEDRPQPQPQQQEQQHQHQRVFFQLTGHQECFRSSPSPGTILKRSSGNELECLNKLMNDELAQFVPKIIGTIEQDGICYLEMQDLLANFEGSSSSVMDIKMGCRTYREQELDSALKEAKLRGDMFDKMIEVDESEPTCEEKKLRAITKPRYMIWRETVSSTASLGFRIEGMRLNDGTIDKDFKTTKDEAQIARAFIRYATSKIIILKYLNRLYDLKRALMKSEFFHTHELIGSSLLFVHSDTDANIWLIDFAKTYPLPESAQVTHRKKWELGNHEDGYLIGIDNLIRIFETIILRTTDRACSPKLDAKQTLQPNKAPEQDLTTSTKHHHQASIPCAKLNPPKPALKERARFLPGLRI